MAIALTGFEAGAIAGVEDSIPGVGDVRTTTNS